MKIYKWAIIGIIIAYIMGAIMISRVGEIDGWNYQTITIWYAIIGSSIVYSVKTLEEGSSLRDNISPLSQRLERVERICNACVISGGKMKCEFYRNPRAVITRCENSKNPDGEK